MSAAHRAEPGRLLLHVRLTPRGGRDAVESLETGADGKTYLKARVRAVAEDGKANAALEALLAKKAGIPGSAVKVVLGQTARLKQVELKGDPAAIAAALGLSQG